MKRKSFIRNSFIAGLAGALAPHLVKAVEGDGKDSTYDKLMDRVGFNHLPQ